MSFEEERVRNGFWTNPRIFGIYLVDFDFVELLLLLEKL